MAASKRTKPPFRADHVGSLLRPAELSAARERWRKGELSTEALRAVEDKAVREAVAMQESVGLQSITDGEFRRDYWHLDFMWQFDGVQPSEEQFAAPFSGGEAFVAPFAQVVGKVRYPAAGIMRDHFAFLRDATRATPKFTVPAPTMFRHRTGRRAITEQAYPDLDAFWTDLGHAYNAAMTDMVSLGCRYLQLDDVNSALLCDTGMRERIRGQGEDPDRLLDRYIRVLNAAVAGRPADITVVTHMCRGNYRSQWMTSGGYDAIAEKLLAQVDIDGFFMEYDTDRAGDFQPLRFLPKGKIAVLGIVTSKAPQLEEKDMIKRRVEEATRYANLDQLCLSPQCGFSSTHHGNNLTPDEQRRKLALVVEVADEIWGSA
jgi:5-methyltetrahydropteroyltriglutamate--homocysteine methyltransferase